MSIIEESSFAEPSGWPDASVASSLRGMLRGQVISAADPGYDEARRIHNWAIDRHPALIARCTGAADTIQTLQFARQRGLPLSIRGGGHHVAGNAIVDDGVVVDLSRMKGVRIDPAARRARVEPGVTWGELNQDLQVFGLGATGGYVSVTGIPGLTLGGGFGWLVRKHGLALDNLVSVDLVTAGGHLLVVSESENAELFWGVRGGGSNFGIATSLEFRVHPVGTVLAGLVVFPRRRAGDVLRMFREEVARAPDELTSGALMFHMPEVAPIPKGLQGLPVIAIAVCYAGPIAEGERVLRRLRTFGPPLADLVQAMPFSVAQRSADALWPSGLHNYWKSSFLSELTDEAIDTIETYLESVPSPRTVVVLDHNGGGAISRVDVDATAFAHRAFTYNFLVTSLWADPEDAARNIAWTRDFLHAMQPARAEAIYGNYTSDRGAEVLASVYPPTTLRRLRELKRAYDPTNVFRANHNVDPA
jgi:FAD/FMN-containing dehydrogenase